MRTDRLRLIDDIEDDDTDEAEPEHRCCPCRGWGAFIRLIVAVVLGDLLVDWLWRIGWWPL